MRVNQPVTNIETPIPQDVFIYSTTDLEGTITSVNEAFIEISGFSRDELIGAPHNIVRHPDMPSAAFEDLWRTLKEGLPWCALVKNRRKDGGFYWVEANASPIRENGKVIGYGSVRRCPKQEAVTAAEVLYAQLRQGKTALTLRKGQPWSSGLTAGLARLGLITKIRIIMGLSLLGGIALAGISLYQSQTLIFYMGIALTVVLFIPLLHWLPKLHTNLRGVASDIEKMQRSGDFSAHIAIKGDDLATSISQGVNALAIDVETVLHETQSSAIRVAEDAQGLCQAIAQVSTAQSSLNSSSAATAATLEQITVAIDEAAANAAEGVKAAEENRRISDMAGHDADDAVIQISSIAEQVRSAGAAVSALSQRSQEIGNMAGEIKEIAEQTNLLALNAAIEAARAGEQGRGFAVVADEVRELAERTSRATMEIDSTIQAIQGEISGTVETMKESCGLMGNGVDRVQSVRNSLSKIQETSQHALERARAIADTSTEQGVAANDIARNVELIAQTVETQSVDITAIEQLASDFQKTSENLRRKLTHFRLSD